MSGQTDLAIDLLAPLEGLRRDVKAGFRERFGRNPRWIAAAPGRVNVIGEHTDYNGGYVLPMAIERYVVIAAGSVANQQGNNKATASFYSADLDETVEIYVAGKIEAASPSWCSYVQGVVAGFLERGFAIESFDAIIQSTVPLGGGLSSSAALEVATATLLECMLGVSLDPVEKALLCQQAEHTFAGVPCGIMDQFCSIFGRHDELMLLDCRSQTLERVPLTDPDVTVLIANSNVKHELTGGEYARRRASCEQAARALGVSVLRDATPAQLEGSRAKLDEPSFRRARHVITEIQRTLEAADAIRAGRWHRAGELMYASHQSLRDDYEVSCEELDLLVELASDLGEAGGVIGSRMTGGGFGGCTVSLVKTAAAARVAQTIRDRYTQKTGIEPTLFTSRPAKGALVIQK